MHFNAKHLNLSVLIGINVCLFHQEVVHTYRRIRNLFRQEIVHTYRRIRNLQLVENVDYGLNKNVTWDFCFCNLTGTAKLVVTVLDVNDERPMFQAPAYSLGLEENQAPGFEVGKVGAVDADQAPFNRMSFYFQPGGSLSDAFAIDRKSGRIVTTRSLDREQQDVYHLVTVARDDDAPSLSSSASVTIYVMDLNDNRPVFVQPTGEVIGSGDNTTAVVVVSNQALRGAVATQVCWTKFAYYNKIAIITSRNKVRDEN